MKEWSKVKFPTAWASISIPLIWRYAWKQIGLEVILPPKTEALHPNVFNEVCLGSSHIKTEAAPVIWRLRRPFEGREKKTIFSLIGFKQKLWCAAASEEPRGGDIISPRVFGRTHQLHCSTLTTCGSLPTTSPLPPCSLSSINQRPDHTSALRPDNKRPTPRRAVTAGGKGRVRIPDLWPLTFESGSYWPPVLRA